MRWKQAYTLYKRGRYWYYRVYDDEGIRSHGISTGQTSRDKARLFCDELLKADKLGILKRIDFQEYATKFLADDSVFYKDRLRPVTDRTKKAYSQYLKNYLLPYTEGLALQDIRYSTLKEHRTKLLETVSPSTVIKAMSLYNMILEQAFREGKIKENPFRRLEKMGNTLAKRDAFTLSEVIYIYQNMDEIFKSMVLLMALTGMRISEAHGVRREDVKKSGEVLYIDLKEQFIHNKRDKLKTKDERQIPIIPEIVELIPDYFSPPAFYRRFVALERECPEAEKRLLSIHSLRHFFISNAKANDINNLKVEKIAGHKLKGMEGVYTSFTVEDLSPILSWQKNTLDKILSSGPIEKSELLK